jgi:Rrf2 family transcriptional regulator, iron-sulfur cluster assembly transcription factor
MTTQTVRYALQILGHLRDRSGGRVRVEEAANATGIPANYLSKILNRLRKAGLVESRKGWGGGFALRPEANSAPIADIVLLFEGARARTGSDCGYGWPRCDSEHPCPLHPYWQQIRGHYDEMLDKITIGDLASRPR